MSRVEEVLSAALAHALDETTRTVVRVVRRENSLHGFTTGSRIPTPNTRICSERSSVSSMA